VNVDQNLDDQYPVFSDEELTRLALAAPREPAVSRDAVPWSGAWSNAPLLIPEWYMPRPAGSSRGRGALVVIGLVTVGFLIIDACGLCVTSGFLSLA
jgi:hypothetical protein